MSEKFFFFHKITILYTVSPFPMSLFYSSILYEYFNKAYCIINGKLIHVIECERACTETVHVVCKNKI